MELFRKFKGHVIDFGIFPTVMPWEKDGATMDGANVSQYMNKGGRIEAHRATCNLQNEWSFRLNDKKFSRAKLDLWQSLRLPY
jgi:hypothetical protein